MPFRNPVALLGLLSIVPLIVLYLIRPKPRDLPFSSTKFIAEGEAKRSAVLSRLFTDPLFWMQLMVLSLLASAAAGPYTVATGSPGSHLVVVFDQSASMEASFKNAVELAELHFSDFDRISIVLAESVPVVALKEGSDGEARELLREISPRAITADISSAMIMAASMIGAEGGGILVVSDFLSWSGDDPEVTRKLIESDGVEVVFADSGTGGDNVAIVGGWIMESTSNPNYSCLIHNYGRRIQVPVTVSSPGGADTKTITLDTDSDYYLSFDLVFGKNTVSLEIDDAISLDNTAYVYVPERVPMRILCHGEAGPAYVALRSLPYITVERSGDYSDFDMVVISENASSDGKLNRYIHGGGDVVYVAKNTTTCPEYLPVRITGTADGPASLWTRRAGFAGGIHFDEIGVFSYPVAEPKQGSVTLVETNAVPVLSYWRLGKGTVVYMGLEQTDFYLRPEYPILWYKMVNWLAGVPDIRESNRITGEVIQLGEMSDIETPDGAISTETLILNQTGFYVLHGLTIAANIYNPRESDLSHSTSYLPGAFTSHEAGLKVIEKEIAPWLIILAITIVILELVFIWWRREM